MNKGNLYCLIGLPRSGKTTISKEFQKGNIFYFNYYFGFVSNFNQYRPRVVLSLDDFRLALGHRFNGYAEGTVFHTSSLAAKSLLISGYNVLLDDTHTTEESIKRVLRIDKDATFFRLDVSPDICKQRAIECGSPDLVSVIDRQYKNLQTLTNERIEEIRKEVSANISVDFVTKD